MTEHNNLYMAMEWINSQLEVYKGAKVQHIFDNMFFVSEWSWDPVCDGRFVYKEPIRYFCVADGVPFFRNKNHRVYAPWDIHRQECDAQNICKKESSFGYDYEIAFNNMLKSKGISANYMDGWNELP